MPWIVQKDIFSFLSISYCLAATCIANIIQDLHNILNTTMRTITCIFWHTQAFCRSLYGRGRRSWSYGSWIYYLCNQCLSPLMLWVRISIRARCTTLCDKVCQWLATGQWFYPGPPVSSTTKTCLHNWNIVQSGVKHNQTHYIENIIWLFPYHIPYQPETPISSREL
jgi:hypothetical protein